MYAKAPYSVLQRTVRIHPTLAEPIRTMLGELKPLRARYWEKGAGLAAA